MGWSEDEMQSMLNVPDTPGWDAWRADKAAAVVYQAAKETTAANHDTGKLRLDLIPPEWITALGEVMTAGAPEYGDRNWEKGMKWSRHLGSLLRHLVKWMGGEIRDPRTGLHHLKHVAWRALALVSYTEWGVGENDLSMRWTR